MLIMTLNIFWGDFVPQETKSFKFKGLHMIETFNYF